MKFGSARRAIHQIMPGFLSGDAVGNQAFRIRELLRAWGYESQVYAQFRDTRLSDPGVDYKHYRPSPDNLLIYHHSIGSPIADFVRGLPDRVVMYYHNITPAHFLRDVNPGMADLLEQGRRELDYFRDAPLALAASDYNRQELLALGIHQVEVLPYFVYLDELVTSAEQSAGQAVVSKFKSDDWVNILFVGRIVPNKKQDDLIRAFRYYHQLVNPLSRLLLVGSDVNAPGYQLQLETMTAALDLAEVHFVGPVGLREGLGGYFRAADVFLCLSEHEGFCIPLLEAMRFDVPVMAFNATGVPYALGGAGIVLNQKRYDVIAERVDLLARDEVLRRRVIARQRERLVELAPERVAEQWGRVVERLQGQ